MGNCVEHVEGLSQNVHFWLGTCVACDSSELILVQISFYREQKVTELESAVNETKDKVKKLEDERTDLIAKVRDDMKKTLSYS